MSRVFALVAFLLLAGCATAVIEEDLVPGTRADVIKDVFGGASNLDLLKAAETVKACRLKLPPGTMEAATGDYEEGPWVDVTAAQADRLRALLESPNSYLFGLAKSCTPIYGVRFRCESDPGVIDVNLCFECDIVVNTRDGKDVGGEDFDPIRAELVALCQEVFPGDAEIQSLKSDD